MKVLFILSIIFFSTCSNAVVKRHDVPPENYVIDKMPEYLIDMPHEGHGVLIDTQWVVTVAHTIFYDYVGKDLIVGSKAYEIESVHIHPEYSEPNKNLLKGDLAPLMLFFKSRSDIALIKLTSKVSGVKPVNIYKGKSEKGKKITVYGKGATGNGLTGEDIDTKSLRVMNQFQNIVENSEGNWIAFKFNEPANALPLEGIHGSGDSGGASIIFQQGAPFLVGLSSWQLGNGDISTFKGGLYGTTAYQVRISNYYDWIVSVLGI
ncbi:MULTISPECIES: trypsin-like serine protease [unclassified Colwellia]|uniref:trypsin-like serine protease n=2 Tax=Colwellia TaxID=28228 RepID=UPI0015F69AA3|nr:MULTISPECIES: trypsin-like serine protease [unclassified Colwellia]MBA6357917.1 trypsin-like serine protease [Colwellia sp. BRX8-3]MBA6361987.1 trypsin-like serine protease [Colwellia sp. BRX8-6]MBA6369449.1 trypsin-like serine protease [Colwellia sp. BRX8-5]MBA6379267.1 trypsin-like serine protease [Colwellia sp. BRX10-7]MBA6385987.1 trypsin-like serine protease [Colwellia sp. BRX10-2]